MYNEQQLLKCQLISLSPAYCFEQRAECRNALDNPANNESQGCVEDDPLQPGLELLYVEENKCRTGRVGKAHLTDKGIHAAIYRTTRRRTVRIVCSCSQPRFHSIAGKVLRQAQHRLTPPTCSLCQRTSNSSSIQYQIQLVILCHCCLKLSGICADFKRLM